MPLLLAVFASLALPSLPSVTLVEGTVHVVTDLASWTSGPKVFDSKAAYFMSPSRQAIRLVFLEDVSYVQADVPVACAEGGVLVSDAPGVTVEELACRQEAAREFVNDPILIARPCLDPSPPCQGRSAITARYAAAYGEYAVENARVKFAWTVYDTTDGRTYFGPWESEWFSLTGVLGHVPATPTPTDFVALCADGTLI